MQSSDDRHVSQMTYGDHACVIYGQPAEALALAAPFLSTGLRHGDCCIYITGEQPVEQVAAALESVGVDIRQEQDRGALILTQSYFKLLQTDRFDPPTMVALGRQAIDLLTAAGFSGVRLVVDMSWARMEGIRDDQIVEFETLAHELFRERCLTAICQYPRQGFAPRLIENGLRTHPLVLVGDRACMNLYHEPPDLLPDEEAAGRVDWMLARLTQTLQMQRDPAARARQHAVVAELGRMALAGTDLASLMGEAVNRVRRTLGVDYVDVLEFQPGQLTPLLRAWTRSLRDTTVAAPVFAGPRSPAAYVLKTGEPVVVRDLRVDERFADSPFLKSQGIVSGASVPMAGHGRLYGVLGAFTTVSRTFTTDDLHFLQSVGNVLAMAIGHERTERERVQLLERDRQARTAAEQTAEMLRRLQAVMDEALAHLDLSEMLNALLDRVRDALEMDTAAVLLVSQNGEWLESRAARGLEDGVERDVCIPVGRGFAGRVAQERRPLAIEDLDRAQVWSPVLRKTGIKSLLGAPLKIEDRVLGVIHVGSRHRRRFTDDEIRLLQVVADRLAMAIDHSRLYEAERRARAEAEATQARLSFLAEASAVLSGSLDYETTLQVLARLAVPRLADWCTVTILDERGAVLRKAAHADPAKEATLQELIDHHPLDLDAEHGVGKVLRTGQSEFLPEVPTALLELANHDPHLLPILRHLGVRSAIIVPLVARGHTFGAMSFLLTESKRRYTAADLALAEDLGRRAAVAVDNARLYRDAQVAEAGSRLQSSRMAALADASRILAEARLDLGAVLDTVVRRIGTLFGDFCGIYLLDDDGRRLNLAAIYHPVPETLASLSQVGRAAPLRADDVYIRQVIRDGQALRLLNATSDDLRASIAPAYHAYLDHIGSACVVLVPLRVHGTVMGMFGVARADPTTPYTAEDQILLQDVADRVALAIENARLYQKLAERERRLHDLVRHLLVAQERERRRVAYDVHDGLAQVAASTHQHLQAFAHDYPPASPQARRHLVRALDLAQQTVSEARRVIADLRPTALDDFGLGTAVRLQVDELRSEGWHVSYTEQLGAARLPVMVEAALFRVVQEALSNVRKHAGVTSVQIRLERRDGIVRLEIRDGGVGFDPETVMAKSDSGEHVGLPGMQERIALLRGTFTLSSQPGAGTQIVAEVPVSPAPWEGTADDIATLEASAVLQSGTAGDRG